MRSPLLFTAGPRRWTFLLISLLVGCSGDGGDGYTGPRGEVTGTITYQGNPVPTGSVVMFQTLEGASFIASGMVKADGTYTLSYQGVKQMPCVSYSVQVTPPAVEPQQVEEIDPAEVTARPELSVSAEPVDLPFPAKYTSIQTSGLTFTVEAGLNVADFELEDE